MKIKTPIEQKLFAISQMRVKPKKKLRHRESIEKRSSNSLTSN